MKLDNKGFAISGILYAVMLLFLTIVISLLALISNRKLILDKYKRNVKESLNTSIEAYNSRIQLAENTSYVRMSEEELSEYDFKSQVSGCRKGGETDPEIYTLCQFNETDITNILNYKIYDSLDHEIIMFEAITKESVDGFKTNIVSYSYYEKDSKGNYIIDETGNSLKVTKKYLQPQTENMFYIRYYIVDSHNILARDVTRTLIVNKYNNYVNIVNSYFKVDQSSLDTYDFKINASSYKYESGNLVKDNSLLKYDVYNSEDKKVTFYNENGIWYYRTSSNEVVNLTDSEEKFRVRYYTGSTNNLTSEVRYAYFNFE